MKVLSSIIIRAHSALILPTSSTIVLHCNNVSNLCSVVMYRDYVRCLLILSILIYDLVYLK